ncbi:MAG: hypothetical protein AB1610_04425 [Nitrospirota bacterium]
MTPSSLSGGISYLILQGQTFSSLTGQTSGLPIFELPSSLAFSLVVEDWDANAEEIVNRLESLKEVVIQYIENCIRIEGDHLALDDVREYSIPGLEDALILMLSKPSGKITRDETSYHVGSSPIFYSQKEYRKFGDVIVKSLHQMLPNMINVLVIGSNSSTHEENDLFKSIYSINRLLRTGDEGFFIDKSLCGKQDFLNQSKRLSGILFRNNWIGLNAVKDRNLLWCNEQADQQIPEPIKEYLRTMNKRALWDSCGGEEDY